MAREQRVRDEKAIFGRVGNTLGLRVLREPSSKESLVVDMIFIHGITGSAFSTFYHPSGVYWPLDLLPDDFPQARIMTFGYDADVVNAVRFTPAGNSNLRDQATALVSELASERRGRAATRKIILVVHSLGGLVAKKAICVSAESPTFGHDQLSRHIVGLLFLGTPHQGSELANYAGILARVARLIKPVNLSILNVLKPSSEVLEDVRVSFEYWHRKNQEQLRIVCFYEEKEVSLAGFRTFRFVVPKQSATLPFCDDRLPIPAHHMDMPKFSRRNEVGYRRVRKQIRLCLELMQRLESGPAGLTERPSQLGDAHGSQPHSRQDIDRIRGLLSAPEARNRESGIQVADDTCDWLLRHEAFEEWLERGRGVLCMIGNPGAGKSHLMKFALTFIEKQSEHPEQLQNLALRHFFYALGSESQSSARAMLMSLLDQLVLVEPRALDKLFRQYPASATQQSPYETRLEEPFLWELLEDAIGYMLERSDIRLFIDALDECKASWVPHSAGSDMYALISQFQRLEDKFHSALYRFSICLSFRHQSGLLHGPERNLEIVVEQENAQGLRNYISRELPEDKFQDVSQFRLDLSGRLADVANGNFQWACLASSRALTMHLKGESQRSILQAAEELPPGLEDFYSTIMQSLREHQPSDQPQANFSAKLFQCICFAIRPLKVSELRDALNLDANLAYTSEDDVKNNPLYIESDLQMEKRVVSLSGGLAEVVSVAVPSGNDWPLSPAGRLFPPTDADSDTDSEGYSIKRVVRLIHQSVKEYLISGGFGVLNQQLVDNPVAQGHHFLAVCCIISDTMKSHIEGYQELADDLSIDFIGEWAQRYNVLVKEGNWLELKPRLDEAVRAWQRGDRSEGIKTDMALKALDLYLEATERLEERQKLSFAISSYATTSICKHLSQIFLWTEAGDDLRSSWADILSRRVNNPWLLHYKTSLLCHCIQFSPPELFLKVLEIGGPIASSVNRRNFNGITPLMSAASAGMLENVKALLDNFDVDVNAHAYWDEAKAATMGKTALTAAAQNGNEEIVRLLLDKGASVSGDPTCLFQAVARGHTGVCNLLLEPQHHADLERTNVDGLTALAWAAECGQAAVAKILIGKGAAVWAGKDISFDVKPMARAIKEDEAEVVEILLEKGGADVDIKQEFRTTLYCQAAWWNSPNTIRLLHRENCSDLNEPDSDGNCPLHMALSHDSFGGGASDVDIQAVLALLDNSKLDLNVVDSMGFTPLMLAIINNVDQVFRELLRYNRLDINQQTSKGTALYWAVLQGKKQMVRDLLNRTEIEPYIGLQNDFTPLHEAVRQSSLSIIKELMHNARVNPLEGDAGGVTPLCVAAGAGGSRVMELLLSYRVMHKHINAGDRHQRTPLSYAAQAPSWLSGDWQNYDKIVEKICRIPTVQVNKTDAFGCTPLDWAKEGQRRQREQARILATEADEEEATDQDNRSRSRSRRGAIDHERIMKRREILVRHLEQRGAVVNALPEQRERAWSNCELWAQEVEAPTRPRKGENSLETGLREWERITSEARRFGMSEFPMFANMLSMLKMSYPELNAAAAAEASEEGKPED